MNKRIFSSSTALIIFLLVIGTQLHQGYSMAENENITTELVEETINHPNINLDDKSKNNEHNSSKNIKTPDASSFHNKTEFPEIIKRLKTSAVLGSADAQFILAKWYQNIIFDKNEALKWFHLAAEQGHAEAQYHIGLFFDEGIGIPTDKKEAVKWYRMAAVQGHASALCNLGICYNEGEDGLPKDAEKAVQCFLQAAEQGNAIAQYNLGIHYLLKDALNSTQKEAVKWLRKAAEQGNSQAQVFLGGCYELGIGVKQDEIEAAKWYYNAKVQGISLDSTKLILNHILNRHQDSKK